MFRLITMILTNLASKYTTSSSANNAESNGRPNMRYQFKAPFNANGLPKFPKWFKRAIITVLILLLLLIIALVVCTLVVPDILWYSNLGYANVLWIKWFVPVIIFAIGFFAATILSWLSLELVFRLRTAYQVAMFKAHEIDDIKERIAEHKHKYFLGVSAIIGLIFGIGLSSSTNEFLLLFGSTPFGQVDPIFGNDISFYTFILPGVNSILSNVIGMLIIMLIVAFITGGIFGQIRIKVRQLKYGKLNLLEISKPLRIQLGIYAALIMLGFAAEIYFAQFGLLTSSGSKVATGAGWVDVQVRIPVYVICAVLLAIIAVLFVIAGFAGKIQPPLIASAVLGVVAICAGAILPVVMQNFVVNPNAQEKENAYIGYNIAATNEAFGIKNIDIQQYNATTETTAGQLEDDTDTTAQIRLLDPQNVAPTFRQLQQSKQYYGFPDTLAVDKYTFDGTSHDTVIAARDLDINAIDSSQRNWVNDHTVYTHGFGLVAAYGNQVTSDGQPKFYEKDIPTTGKLTDTVHYEPRIYFSKSSPAYSIVGAPNGQSWELDYPDAPNTVSFEGNGGPKLDNLLVKFVYALRMGDYQMLFSDRVNANSQILYDRDPAVRVREVAPYLDVDSRVYPAAIDGRIKWILDGYTTTNNYPYAKRISLYDATKDALTESSSSLSALDSKSANYIRNSVKAVVDAYDGSVTLYAWDPNDPVLKTWSKIYGQNLHPISEISGELMAHIRYPEDLFKVQRNILKEYHVGDATSFYSGEDFWEVPTDPASAATGKMSVKQPPYYLSLTTPDRDESVFSLTTSFIPAGGKREFMTGFLTADADAGNIAGEVGANYGKLHLLTLPKNTSVPGPGQAQNNFNANADVSKELNLLQGSSSSILRGNLLTLPIGGGLVYVQPVYVQSTGNTQYPLLKKVLVAFGDKVGFAGTLQEALNQVFGGNAGAKTGETNIANSTSSPSQSNSASPIPGDATSNAPAPATDDSGKVKGLEEAEKALKDAQDAIDKALKAVNDAKQ